MRIKNGKNLNIKPPTILLVEDNYNDVLLIKRAFRKSNIVNPIKIVENGQEAIAYLAGEGVYSNREQYPLPVLILLDLKLPRKSGHEALAWLCQQPGLRRIPIVVLTSSRQAADINRAYDLGVNSYLIKPVSFDALLEMAKTLNMYWLVLNEGPEIILEGGE